MKHSLLALLSLVLLPVASETAGAGTPNPVPAIQCVVAPVPGTFLAALGEGAPSVVGFEPWMGNLLLAFGVVYLIVKTINECLRLFGRKPAVGEEFASLKKQIADLCQMFLTREEARHLFTREEAAALELSWERSIGDRLSAIDEKRSEQVAAIHRKIEDETTGLRTALTAMPSQILTLLQHAKGGRAS